MINTINGWKWNVEELQRQNTEGADEVMVELNAVPMTLQEAIDALYVLATT